MKDKQLALQGKNKEASATDVAIAALAAEIKALETRIDTWLEDEAVTRRTGESCVSILDSKPLTVTDWTRSCRRTPQR